MVIISTGHVCNSLKILCAVDMEVCLIFGEEFPQSVFAFGLVVERSHPCADGTLWVTRNAVALSE